MLDFEKLGFPLWLAEIVIAAALLVASAIVARIASFILENLRIKFEESHAAVASEVNPFRKLRAPIYYLMLVIGATLTFTRIKNNYELPHHIAWLYPVIAGIIYSVGVLVAMILIMRACSLFFTWYARNIAVRTESHLDDEFIPLADRLMKIVVIIFGIMVILSHFHVDIRGLLAVLGVGSLAVALAAKDTLANMISGFIIMIDRPFREGDRVILASGQECEVYEIGLRSCKFLTFDNTMIVVPNDELARSSIVNINYPDPKVRVVINIGVAYGSDLDFVKTALLDCAKAHPKVVTDPAPYVKLLNFGENSLDLTLRCEVASLEDQFGTQCDLREMIYKKFQELNIEIPFPQRSLWIEKAPSSSSVDKALNPSRGR